MDKRLLAGIFRERLAELIARQDGGLSRFADQTGLDRSALSQFLNEGVDRLPRAESLRKIAQTKKVTVDWLLGLSNVANASTEFKPGVEVEEAIYDDGGSPIDRWRREVAGQKLRYVPTTLPDMLRLPEINDFEISDAIHGGHMPRGDALTPPLDDDLIGDMDIEIAMPVETMQAFAESSGYWQGLPIDLRERQLRHMANLVAERYPSMRLHFFSQRLIYAAPVTVFGRQRAAVYIGGSYLVVTALEQVRELNRHFDRLIRAAIVGPDRAADTLSGFLNDAVARSSIR